MRGPLNFKFANHFICYQKRPLRERIGTGRLHSELWDMGVKVHYVSSINISMRIFNDKVINAALMLVAL